MKKQTHALTLVSMLLALGVLLHTIESMIPLPVLIPGFRLGLANIVGMIALYLFSARIMLSVNLMRVLFSSLLRGVLFGAGFWLSLGGVLLSSAACVLAKRWSTMSIYGVSVAGSVFHSIGQVIVVTFLYQQFFMQAILPLLILLGIPSGLLIAWLARQVINRLSIGKEKR